MAKKNTRQKNTPTSVHKYKLTFEGEEVEIFRREYKNQSELDDCLARARKWDHAGGDGVYGFIIGRSGVHIKVTDGKGKVVFKVDVKEEDLTAPYARLVVLERDPGRSEGAERMAVLFLGADGHATFEAVFANGNAPNLFGFLLQEHGFGGNYDKWGKDGICDAIMLRSGVFPKFVLAGSDDVYDGYREINGLEPSGDECIPI